jgi:hypothetical protein
VRIRFIAATVGALGTRLPPRPTTRVTAARKAAAVTGSWTTVRAPLSSIWPVTRARSEMRPMTTTGIQGQRSYMVLTSPTLAWACVRFLTGRRLTITTRKSRPDAVMARMAPRLSLLSTTS